MHVSTIIVSYNTFELTVAAVESAFASAAGLEHEVIVVDNHSPDESGRRLTEHFRSDDRHPFRLIQLADNVGFAAANNVGAPQAAATVLFFLNPDTIVHADAVSKLFHFLDGHPEAGAVGPRVLNRDGTDQVSVGSFVTVGSLFAYFFPLAALGQSQFKRAPNTPASTTEVDVVKGCAVAVRRDVFDRIGGWDESYFLYAEERELCIAAQALGLRNYFLREASITHFGGASTERENYAEQQLIQQRSSLQFIRRHYGPALIGLNRVLGVLGFGVRAAAFPLLRRITGNPDYGRRGEAAGKLFRWYLSEYRVTP